MWPRSTLNVCFFVLRLRWAVAGVKNAMVFAFLTTVLWSFAGFGSSRIARHYGSAPANGLRLLCATALLTGWVLLLQGNLRLPPGAGYFALSGILHLAVGDVALFAVYRRLGPRIGVLAVSSLAPMVAMCVEWGLLGTAIPGMKQVLGLGVLVSVVLAVAPRDRGHLSAFELRRGALAALLATVGQGASAAVTRMGYAEARAAGMVDLGPWMPTLLRCAAGGAGVLVYLAVGALRGKAVFSKPADLLHARRIEGHPLFWLGVSTLLGPVLGVMTLMKALEAHPAGLVQAVLSTLPVMMLPLAWYFDGTVPSRRSMGLGFLAVVLAMLMALPSP